MQDDQRSEDQIPEESGSAPGGADALRQPGQSDADAAHLAPAQTSDSQPPSPEPPSPQAPSPQPPNPWQGDEPESTGGIPFFAQTGGYSQPGYSQAGYGQPGYGQTGHGEPGYGQTAPLGYPGGSPSGQGGGYGPAGHGQASYGQASYGPGGYGPGGYGPGGPGGYGQGGYGGYYPEPGSRARRRRTLLTYLTVAVVAAAVGAGLTGYALTSGSNSPSSASGQPNGGAGNRPGGFPGFPGGGHSSRHGVSGATQRAVVSAVRPGLVDISSNLGYQGSQAAATGMVISSDGLVLTNNHVITDTTQLFATVLATGKRYSAKWLGYDSADDVAVIKLIGARNLRTVPLGDSSTVHLGDKVVAIGNAYGAGRFPAVAGRITGMNRTITASDSGAATKETLHGMLQTNAGIVQGDSGGPLSNTSGKVIGMNTAAATGSFGSSTQNVGFAIPINKALHIARQIISGKSSPSIQIGSTGFLGVLVPAGQASLATSPKQQRD
ncbi:MAG TPA: trypsin-like peptidase domain-containing protein, partial [Streptosporangiaceae bacterium]